MNYFYIIISVIFTCVCLYSAYQYYRYFQSKTQEKHYLENKEFLKKASNINSELYFFHTKWCPHCKDSQEMWDYIKKDPKFKKFSINFIQVDCEDKKNKGLVSEYNVKEYPSYVLQARGKKYIYDANLNDESLYRFLTAVYKQL